VRVFPLQGNDRLHRPCVDTLCAAADEMRHVIVGYQAFDVSPQKFLDCDAVGMRFIRLEHKEFRPVSGETAAIFDRRHGHPPLRARAQNRNPVRRTRP
jgi:hypothetical protein